MTDTTTSHSATRIQPLFIAFATLATWVLHEGGHWIAGTLLGYETHMTLNGTNTAVPVAAGAPMFWFDFAGPLVTYLEAGIAFMLLLRRRSKGAYAVLLICTYMRSLAAALSFILLNDESRISRAAGIGAATLPLLVCGILIAASIAANRRHRFGTRTTLATLGWILLLSSLLILADMKWAPRIL